MTALDRLACGAYNRHMNWQNHLKPYEATQIAALDKLIAMYRKDRTKLYNRARRRMHLAAKKNGDTA